MKLAASGAPRRPAVRYHGGKWMLANWIIGNMPKHRVYVEPYGGGASVLLRKPKVYAEVYNDLDGEIVSLFRVLQEPATAERLRRLLELTPFSRAEFDAAYEPAEEPVERARRTLIRSYMGFGSNSITADHGRTGFRASALRQGTTPGNDWSNWPAEVPRFTERLRGVCIENRPALAVIGQQDGPDTLFYVDPPYIHSTRSQRNQYDPKHFYRHEMSDDDHRELAAVLHGVEGMVLLSGYPCDLYDRELYPTWERITREALADGARRRVEVLYLNPAATARASQQMFSREVAS